MSRGFADGAEDSFGGGIYIAGTNTELVIVQNCQVQENYALQGSSLYNQAESHIENSTIHNTVIPGITTCSVLNTGLQASLTLNNCIILQECVVCPEIIRNINGAILLVNNTVSIEKE